MFGAMRSAVTCALAVASLAACGPNDLQPIRDPPGSDAAIGGDAAAADAGPGERDGNGGEIHDGGDIRDGSGTPDASSAGCKRGLAANAAPSAAFAPTASSPGLAWWYNWASQSPGGDARIEFVPMIWGGGSLGQTIPAGSTDLLGFNEPNFKAQADLTAEQAAADWPMVEAKGGPGIRTVSPGVNFCGSASDSSQCTESTVTDPYTYLKDFFAACSGCRVDAVAVHWYNCDLPSLRAYLEGNTDAGGTLQGFVQFGKPIWLTEFSCDDTHSVADQMAYMQAAVPYLESNPHVARYAWFSAKNIPNAELANSDGSLTDLGTTYVGLPESCR
jgi:hypothetical protein